MKHIDTQPLALQHPNGSRLIPASSWNEHHSWPPIGGLRHLIFNGHKNGFERCIRRVGRRVLIDEQAFFAWIDAQGMGEK